MVSDRKLNVSDYKELYLFPEGKIRYFFPPCILMEDRDAENFFFLAHWGFYLLLETESGVWFVVHLRVVGTLKVVKYI